ncbi:MAG: adenylate/guanylate cyclase domain-containing protein [Tepidisphaeraceae bacterium]
MSWSHDIAAARVKDRSAALKLSDYTVVDLTRERDFYNLGSKEVCRAKGAHIYADVTNLHRLVNTAGNDKDEQKKIVRAVSVLRRTQGDILSDYDVPRMQMQSARLHAMCHKPYDGDNLNNEPKRVECAVKLAITLQSYLYDVFNEVFTDLSESLRGAVGIDSGRFLIAHIGYRGDRELISLGDPANIAAKIIGESGTITLPKRLYDMLPQCLKDEFAESSVVAGVQTYQASGLRWKKKPELAEKLAVKFDHEKWKKATQDAKDNLPLSAMEVSGVEAKIELDVLTERNSKRFDAAPFYADLDGFTALIQSAKTDDELKALVRAFDLIRGEFQTVIESDFDGYALQHQGDCVLGIAYMPAGDIYDSRRRRKGLDIAIGIQSSMEHVLPAYIGRTDIHVAIGVSAGKVLLTRLGKKGERELIAMSPPVSDSQRMQEITGGKQTRISKEVYDAINDDNIREEFGPDSGSYVATGLTFPKLDSKENESEEKAARAGSLAARVTSSGTIATVVDTFRPARPYARRD